MIKYYCNTRGEQVKSLSDLIDIASKRSDDPQMKNNYFFGGAFSQDHVCSRCVHAIKHFLTTLRTTKAVQKPTDPSEITTSVQ
jgi:hypothetical protein